MAALSPTQSPSIRIISSPPPPPPPPWKPWPSKRHSSSQGGVITGLVIGFVAFVFLISVVWSIWMGRRDSRARAAAGASAATAPRVRHDDDQQLRGASASSQTACSPAFNYSPSVKHNVTDDGEEAATCSVCLGAFQLGETVRLLLLCLHLYHMECIDPWLDAHSTCPLCRSETDASMDIDVAGLPPI